MILKITKMSDYDFAIFIYDECEKCEMPKNPYHDKHGCPKEVEEEELDSNGNSNSDYKKAEKECPIGYIVVWNRWEKGFKYRKLDKDGYMEQLEEEEEEYQWWGHTYTDERGNTISFFNATEKWIEENAEYKYNEYGRLDCFKDMR